MKPIPSVEDYFIVKYRNTLPSVDSEESKHDRDAVMAEVVPAVERPIAENDYDSDAEDEKLNQMTKQTTQELLTGNFSKGKGVMTKQSAMQEKLMMAGTASKGSSED